LNNELIKLKEEIKNQSLISELSLKNKISEAVTNLEKENSSLTNSIEKMKLEHSINEKLIEEKFKSKISERDLTIQELREMKSRLSTKMIGETLEIHCETQFNLNRASAFKNSYFEKDNDATSGSKGDYIFREFDKNNNLWIFYDGRLTITQDDGTVSFINFNRYQYPLGEGPIDLAKVPSDANDMTLKQAKMAEALYQKSGNVKEARKMRVRIQEKFTLPAACLVFGLIGSGLGVRSISRSSKSQGFGVSVLLIFGYYILSFFSSSLGVKGILNPFIAAWAPVFLSITVALLLVKRASEI